VVIAVLGIGLCTLLPMGGQPPAQADIFDTLGDRIKGEGIGDSAMATDGENLYIVRADHLYVYSARSLAMSSSLKLPDVPDTGSAGCLVAGGHLFVAKDRKILRMALGDPQILAQNTLDNRCGYARPEMLLDGSSLYLTAEDRLYKLSADSLAEEGRAKLEDARTTGLASLCKVGGLLYVLKEDRVYKVDAGSMTVESRTTID